jgi:hypothetical protein
MDTKIRVVMDRDDKCTIHQGESRYAACLLGDPFKNQIRMGMWLADAQFVPDGYDDEFSVREAVMVAALL